MSKQPNLNRQNREQGERQLEEIRARMRAATIPTERVALARQAREIREVRQTIKRKL